MERILKALAKLRPSARKTVPLKTRGDHLLMRMLNKGGLRGVERLVGALNAKGHRFQPVESGPGGRFWREDADGRVFEIRVRSNRVYKMAALRYLAVPKLTRAEIERAAVQKAFYDRYVAIGQRAYRNPGPLPAVERRLLLVGELEADVNNGGFSQYLLNKGRRRAGTALAALKVIGARKTARLLAQALAPSVSEAKLAALDDAFYKAPEDLALLAAKHARLTAQRESPPAHP